MKEGEFAMFRKIALIASTLGLALGMYVASGTGLAAAQPLAKGHQASSPAVDCAHYEHNAQTNHASWVSAWIQQEYAAGHLSKADAYADLHLTWVPAQMLSIGQVHACDPHPAIQDGTLLAVNYMADALKVVVQKQLH
jgi:hypothetical protein